MTFEIVVACRRSPARIVGATCPVGVIDVGAPHRMWLWYPTERTTRLHREAELAAVITISCSLRWADFGIEYAKLVARGTDGIAAIDGEAIDSDPALDERELALVWRELDRRAITAIEDHVRATRRQELSWEASAVWLDTSPIPLQPRS